jgi:hypothetical protein
MSACAGLPLPVPNHGSCMQISRTSLEPYTYEQLHQLVKEKLGLAPATASTGKPALSAVSTVKPGAVGVTSDGTQPLCKWLLLCVPMAPVVRACGRLASDIHCPVLHVAGSCTVQHGSAGATPLCASCLPRRPRFGSTTLSAAAAWGRRSCGPCLLAIRSRAAALTTSTAAVLQ